MMMFVQKKTSRKSTSLSEQKVQLVSERFGLSRRESEVLSLLVQGRSAPYIAEVEFIALSTVYTHIKHLYAKMNVHNREELLDIVYDE
jgi:DNA-binding CsgD family transcriptional regulator